MRFASASLKQKSINIIKYNSFMRLASASRKQTGVSQHGVLIGLMEHMSPTSFPILYIQWKSVLSVSVFGPLAVAPNQEADRVDRPGRPTRLLNWTGALEHEAPSL